MNLFHVLEYILTCVESDIGNDYFAKKKGALNNNCANK